MGRNGRLPALVYHYMDGNTLLSAFTLLEHARASYGALPWAVLEMRREWKRKGYMRPIVRPIPR